jgi:hypothetical protein
MTVGTCNLSRQTGGIHSLWATCRTSRVLCPGAIPNHSIQIPLSQIFRAHKYDASPVSPCRRSRTLSVRYYPAPRPPVWRHGRERRASARLGACVRAPSLLLPAHVRKATHVPFRAPPTLAKILANGHRDPATRRGSFLRLLRSVTATAKQQIAAVEDVAYALSLRKLVPRIPFRANSRPRLHSPRFSPPAAATLRCGAALSSATSVPDLHCAHRAPQAVAVEDARRHNHRKRAPSPEARPVHPAPARVPAFLPRLTRSPTSNRNPTRVAR